MPRWLISFSILAAICCSHALAAPEQWFEVSSTHFTVITDSSDKQGRQILDQFERLRWMFHEVFPKANVDPPLPIRIIATRNLKAFQTLEPAAYLGKGQMNLAGLFVRTSDKNYILVRLDAEGEHPFATIYHEYTHLQFSDALEWLPVWLNEGFAEFFQNTEIHNKDALFGVPSVDDILYLRQTNLLPLATLFKVDYNSPYYHQEQKASVFYAESWALTHYLEITNHDNKTNSIGTYLALMHDHQDPVVAAEKAFGNLKQLQSALEDYIRAGDYKHFLLSSAAAPLDEGSYKSRNLPQTEADAVRADFLVRVGRKQDARSLLGEVLKADPNCAQAYETMGQLAFQDGDRDAARNWYKQAVDLDSQSFLAHYNFALMSMNSGDASSNPQVEASLRTAIKLNPHFAPAYDLLASLLAMRRESREDAHILNLQAIQLEPGNVNFRINAASVLSTMGQLDAAIAVLRNAEKIAKNPEQVALVQSRLKQMETVQALRAQGDVNVTAAPEGDVTTQTVRISAAAEPTPKHPTEPTNGPRHVATGVIRTVKCSYPAVLEFHVETGKAPVTVYSNDFFKIELSVLGFTPKGPLAPCSDFEGMKAQVQYAESSDKTVDGQVTAIELRK